jgi:hypothetical protein
MVRPGLCARGIALALVVSWLSGAAAVAQPPAATCPFAEHCNTLAFSACCCPDSGPVTPVPASAAQVIVPPATGFVVVSPTAADVSLTASAVHALAVPPPQAAPHRDRLSFLSTRLI